MEKLIFFYKIHIFASINLTYPIQKLYEHQLKCKHSIANLFNSPENGVTEHKGLIKMFCGSGKSFVIYDTILAFGHKLSVIVVPSICLITQFNKDYLLDPDKISYNKNNYNKSFNIITICSKDEIKDKDTTFTTDEAIIEKSLNKFINKNKDVVVLITYQSLEKLINIIKQNNIKIDLMCFDEAHHILSLNMKKQLFGLDESDYLEPDAISETELNYETDSVTDSESNDESDTNSNSDEYDQDQDYLETNSEPDDNFLSNYVSKVLFFTATPKNTNNIVMYEPHQIIVNDIEYDIVDDINTEYADEPDCGPMIFEYMHLDGVKDGRLNDFKIRVDMYTQDTNGSVFEAIARTILETGNTRVLTFHSRSEVGSESATNVNDFASSANKVEFIKCFKRVLNKEFAHLKTKYKPSEIELIGITAKTKDREKILKVFESTPDNKIFILSSCKTIGEGIDTKNANMVVFVDPKQSYVEIVQNIGRICRKQANLSTVLIPAHVDVGKYKDCVGEEDIDRVIRQEMSKTGDFNGILNVLSALRQEDPYLFELCLKYPETYTKKEIEQNLKNNGLKIEDTEYTPTELFDKYKLKYNQAKTETENFTKLSKLIKKNIQITNDKVLEDDVFIEYTDNTTDIKTEYIVKIADKYQTTVSNKDSIKKISKPNRNIKPIIHTNDDIKVLWKITSDINSDKKMFGGYIEATVKPGTEEYWFEMLNNVKLYIDKNNIRPRSSDKNPKIKKMATWIHTQIQNYKKNIGLIKIKKIKKHWEKFINDYRKYFLSNVEAWESKLSEVKSYIDQFKKRPLNHSKNIQIKTLATWITTQQQTYKKKINIMANPEIYAQWTNFINDSRYLEYFISNETAWEVKLNKVKTYIDQNEKRPSESNKNTNIKTLATWITTQQQSYKKKKEIMANPEIYAQWTNFINDPKYLEYFLSNKEAWEAKLNELKSYINKYKSKPTNCNKDIHIKTLAVWIQRQQNNYKKKSQIMSYPEIYVRWTNFINDPQYLEYFLSNEEVWKAKLNEVKIYIEQNRIRPSKRNKDIQIKTLGVWIGTQQQNYQIMDKIMSNPKIYAQWTNFINDPLYFEYFLSNEEAWKAKLNEVQKYINRYKKRPSSSDKDIKIKTLGEWISGQQKNYKKKTQIMSNPKIYAQWTEFINDKSYSKYFNNITNSESDSDTETDSDSDPNTNTNTKKSISNTDLGIVAKAKTKSPPIKSPPTKSPPTKIPSPDKIHPKSTTIIPKSNQNTTQNSNQPNNSMDKKSTLTKSKYQELTKKMSTQKSQTTQKMFSDDPDLWEEYHAARDLSFKGYDKQKEIPVNKIISYLETKIKYRLKILDLGCGRNLIKQHFKLNTIFNITGYDYVENNGSKVCDISKLDVESDQIDICIYSQSLMGSNWKDYLIEGKRVLRYNGEMIISESVERFDVVKEYLANLEMKIINEEYNETKRWFYINAIKQ